MSPANLSLILQKRSIFQKNLDDLEFQIALHQPAPPLTLLRQRDFFEQELRHLDAQRVYLTPQRPDNALEAFLRSRSDQITDLSRRFQTHFTRPNDDRITMFLWQFRHVEWARFGLTLLEHVAFFDDAKISDMFREFYLRFDAQSRTRVVFTGLGTVQDSSYLINYLCSKALTASEKKDVRFMELKDAIRSRGPSDTTLVFLDDNIGSGKQATRIFREWLGLDSRKNQTVEPLSDSERQWLRQAKLMYFVLTGFDEGIEALTRELHTLRIRIQIVPSLRLREDQGCFGPALSPFVDATERKLAQDMAAEIGYALLDGKGWSGVAAHAAVQ